jgi:hypothetical protein
MIWCFRLEWLAIRRREIRLRSAGSHSSEDSATTIARTLTTSYWPMNWVGNGSRRLCWIKLTFVGLGVFLKNIASERSNPSCWQSSGRVFERSRSHILDAYTISSVCILGLRPSWGPSESTNLYETWEKVCVLTLCLFLHLPRAESPLGWLLDVEDSRYWFARHYTAFQVYKPWFDTLL